MVLGMLCRLACLILKQLFIYYLNKMKNNMAKCPNCEFDITTNGYNTEPIAVPNGTAYLLSCKKCDTMLGIVSEPK
jgi:hypothetical protein